MKFELRAKTNSLSEKIDGLFSSNWANVNTHDHDLVVESATLKAIGRTERARPGAHAGRGRAHGVGGAGKGRPKKQHSEERRNNSNLLCDADAIVLSKEESVDVVGKSSSYQEFENDISGEATSTSTHTTANTTVRRTFQPLASDDESWQLVVAKKPTPKKAVLYVGNISENTTSETLAKFIEERAKGLCVPIPVIVSIR